MTFQSVIQAWDEADLACIHPTREHVSEDAYWASGAAQARHLAKLLPADWSVIDFGCGDGRVTIPLAALGYDVTAADASARMLRELTRRAPHIPVALTQGTALAGFEVDAAICLAVLIHHSWDDGARITAALAGAVRPGGVLALDWPVSPYPCEAATWIGVTTWDRARRLAVARACGLEPLDPPAGWSLHTSPAAQPVSLWRRA